jgi:hypothetical protein
VVPVLGFHFLFLNLFPPCITIVGRPERSLLLRVSTCGQSSYKGRCILISSTDYSIGVPQYCNTVTFP